MNKLVLIISSLLMAMAGQVQASIMERTSTGGPRFCQEFKESFEGKTSHPTAPYILGQINMALQSAGAPAIEVNACVRTNVESHIFGFKTFHYRYSLRYADLPADCNGLISKIVKVDMSKLSQLQSSANEDALIMIEDIAKSLGFVVVDVDTEGLGFFFNSVSLGIRACQFGK